MGMPAFVSARTTPTCAMPRAKSPSQREPHAQALAIGGSSPIAKDEVILRIPQPVQGVGYFVFQHAVFILCQQTRDIRFDRGMPVLKPVLPSRRLKRASMKVGLRGCSAGRGTMGSRIAAHFANAGLPCILLDLCAEFAGRCAARGTQQDCARGTGSGEEIQACGLFYFSGWRNAWPSAILKTIWRDARKRTGSSKSSPKILEIKPQNLLSRVARIGSRRRLVTPTRRPARALDRRGMSEEFQKHWAGTHFFNPRAI